MHISSETALERLEALAAGNVGIASAVAQEAIDYSDPLAFFDDLLEHGCIS